MKKVLAFFRKNRLALNFALMSAMLCMSAFAAGEDSAFNLTTVMTTSVQQIVNDLLACVAAVLPIALTLFAATIGITYTITFVKKILGKSKG